jgi:hypothetical protein
LQSFAILVIIWYIFPRFGILRREKSGNTGTKVNGVDKTSLRHYFYIFSV